MDLRSQTPERVASEAAVAIAEFRASQATLGLTNKQIAALLGTSVRNVEDWRSRTPPKPLARKFLRLLALLKEQHPSLYEQAATI